MSMLLFILKGQVLDVQLIFNSNYGPIMEKPPGRSHVVVSKLIIALIMAPYRAY